MLNKCLIVISICTCISFSAFGAQFGADEKKEIESLQNCAKGMKEISDKVTRLLKEDYSKTPMQWVKPRDMEALSKVVELGSGPGRPLPTNLFPLSPVRDKTPNMLDYGDQLKDPYIIEFLGVAVTKFMAGLNKRKSTGEGLTFCDEAEVKACMAHFKELDDSMRALLSLVKTSEDVFTKYVSKFNTIYILLMEAGKKGYFDPDLRSASFHENFERSLFRLGETTKIEPSLKTTKATVEEEFVKNKLMLDAAFYVHGTCLNIWGNMLRLYAYQYQDHGDGSLVGMLPPLDLLNKK